MNKYPSVKPAVWGAVAGAVAISVIGFSQFGWTLGSSAERMANERAQTAVVTVLTPICVEKFRQQSEATAKLAEFSKATSWDQRSIIEKGGWATISGGETPNSAVATAGGQGGNASRRRMTVLAQAPRMASVHTASTGVRLRC